MHNQQNKAKLFLIGLLFVIIGMIVASLFSLPVWLSSFRMLPGGALRLFFCYFLSVVFFFACGVIVSYVYTYKQSFGQYSKKILTDIMISYVLRLIWIIIFFGSNSVIVSVLCLCASIVFLIFAVISSFRHSLILSLIEFLMIFEEAALLVYNLKFMLLN